MSWEETKINKPILDYLKQNHLNELETAQKDENKNINNLMQYILGRAKKEAGSNNAVMISNEEVFSWAVHYLVETIQDLKSEKVELVNQSKAFVSKSEEVKKAEKVNEVVQKTNPNQMSLF